MPRYEIKVVETKTVTYIVDVVARNWPEARARSIDLFEATDHGAGMLGSTESMQEPISEVSAVVLREVPENA